MFKEIFSLVKGYYQNMTIKPRPPKPAPIIHAPKKPRLMLDFDKNLSIQWKGIVWHHSASTDDITRDDSARIVRYHTSFRINYVEVASPIHGKEPGIKYIKHSNGLWYKKLEYDYFYAEKAKASNSGKVFQSAWMDVAYHGMIEHINKAIKFVWGRPLNVIGAHAGYKEYNHNYLGLCAINNYDRYIPKKDLWDTCLMATRTFMDAFGFPIKKVIGHREVYDLVGVPRKKECPGAKWDMDKFRREL